MTTTQELDGIPKKLQERTRNVMTISAAFRLGKWLPDQDLSLFASHADLAAAATAAVGSTVTEAKMRTVLKQVGLEATFERERGRGLRIQKAGPRLLEALKALQELTSLLAENCRDHRVNMTNDNRMADALALIDELEAE